MTTRQHLEYWLEVFKVLIMENENRRRIPKRDDMTIHCSHCGGSLTISVEYGDDQIIVEARCFNDNCKFPVLKGQFTWKEVHDEAVDAIKAIREAKAATSAGVSRVLCLRPW